MWVSALLESSVTGWNSWLFLVYSRDLTNTSANVLNLILRMNSEETSKYSMRYNPWSGYLNKLNLRLYKHSSFLYSKRFDI